jgi:hypothetical protein
MLAAARKHNALQLVATSCMYYLHVLGLLSLYRSSPMERHARRYSSRFPFPKGGGYVSSIFSSSVYIVKYQDQSALVGAEVFQSQIW